MNLKAEWEQLAEFSLKQKTKQNTGIGDSNGIIIIIRQQYHNQSIYNSPSVKA